MQRINRTLNRTKDKQANGYVLPLVLLITMLMGTSMMAITTRAWLDQKGAIRQSEARAAREVAEAGLASMVETLNRRHAHLLIVDQGQWSNPPLSSSVCSNSSTGVPSTTGTVGSNGFYELESYTFNGSAFYGGKADLRMRGEVRRNGDTRAAAIVTQTIEIKPKSCTTSYGEPVDTSGFPGLLGQTITLGGNDVLGKLSGNVFCIQCASESDVGGNSQSIVGGQIVTGPLDLPPVPTAPASLNLYDTPFSFDASDCKGNTENQPASCAVSNNGDLEIIAGSTDPTKLLNGQCAEDGDGITHCVVEKLLLDNNELRVNSVAGPVRIYFTGTGEVFKSTGNGGIRHTQGADAPSTNLGLFGNPLDPTNSTPDQQFTLRGAADSNNLWAYLPDGNLGIAGGAQDNANCEVLSDGSLGECTGGDIYGAVWAKSWGETNGASSGTGVQIVVPPDMGQQLYNDFGTDYAIGLRDYAALGISKWSSFVLDSGRASS